MRKNIGKVNVVECTGINQISLEIEVDNIIDGTWEQCYRDALVSKGGYMSIRGSGAPTVDKVSFCGNRICTRPFANNQYTKSDSLLFLNELDVVVGIANDLYKRRMELENRESNNLEQERKKNQEEIAKLEGFLNE